MAANYGSPVEYAGFWARTAAYSIDCAIIIIVGVVITYGASFAGDIAMIVGQIIFFLINVLYWPVMESSARQATFGKRIVGIEVVDLNGKRMTFLRALLRNLAKIISSIPLGIGFLLAAFTGRKQALHDMITKSLVVRTRPVPFIKALVATLGWSILSAAVMAGYFYLVVMPLMETEDESAMQEAMKPAAPPPVMPPAPAVPQPVVPLPPVSGVPPIVPAPPQPAVVTPAVPEPEPVMEPVPEPVKPVKKPRKTAKKKPVKAPVAESVAEPAPKPDSEPAAPAESVEVAPLPPATLPQPTAAPVVTDMETRVIRPKYNDLMTAVMRSDREAAKQLLDLGWWVDKPGSDGFTPLVAAVMNRDTQMVKLLLDRGAFPSSQALKLARDKKDAATAALLEQWGAR